MKDDADLTKLNIKPNHAFMMLGTAGELPKGPETPKKFLEDLPDSQAGVVANVPPGLVNLGNTCYMNSTLQAMRTIPELKQALARHPSNNIDLTAELKSLYRAMDSSGRSTVPATFLNALRQRFPQFAERGDDGHFKQQDAEEVWTQLLYTLREALKVQGDSDTTVVDKYMAGSFETETKSDEAPEEGSQKGSEEFLKLDCHISISTNYLKDGLTASLEESFDKRSETLGRDAVYKRTKRVTRLPKYLTVQYMRFFWRRDTQKKSKILRKVTFPRELDVTDLCSDDLKKKVIPVREKLVEFRKEEEDKRRSAKKARLDSGTSRTDPVTAEEKAKYREEIEKVTDASLKNDDGCNPSALYELSAIVTHQGASADSGHYQCFVRHADEEGKWWRFNDDKVSTVDDAKIDSLSGGGESDAALILLYRAADV